MSTRGPAPALAAAGELGLAPLFPVSDFGGSLSDYLDILYALHAAKACAGIRLWGLPLVVPDRKACDGRDQTFWHMVTSYGPERTEQSRLFSPYRCAYLPRVWDVLERLALDDPRVCWWREPRGYVLVTPVDFSLVVKLRRIRGVYVLRTAWPTDTPRRRRQVFNRAAIRWAACQYFPLAPGWRWPAWPTTAQPKPAS